MADLQEHEARLNVTWRRQNGDLKDPVNFDATDDEIHMWAQEAIRAGDVPGVRAEDEVDFRNYMIDRFKADDEVPYNRLFLRPKTEFGRA